jgi:uncharacterized protein (DUF58 family)
LKPSPTDSGSIELTAAGLLFLPFVITAVLAALLLGEGTGLLAALGVVLFLGAAQLVFLRGRGLSLELLDARVASDHQMFSLPLLLRKAPGLLGARQVMLQTTLGERLLSTPVGWLAELEPGQEQCIELRLQLTRRGPVQSLLLELSSTYPFGLLRYKQRFQVPCNLLGLPRRGRLLNLARWEKELARHAPPRPGLRRCLHGELEVQGVREWREGDSYKNIHWKLSAKRDQLITRESFPLTQSPVRLLLVTSATEMDPWSQWETSVEPAIRLCATLIEYFLRKGRNVSLCTTREGDVWEAYGRRSDLRRALLRLARIEPMAGDAWQALQQGRLALGGAGPLICVLAGQGSGPQVAGDSWVIDVDDPDFDALYRPAGMLRGTAYPRRKGDLA